MLEDARAAVAPARRAFEELVAVIEAARSDTRHVYEAGLALELICSKKLYRLHRHGTQADFFKALGISRTTAYKWRLLATKLERDEVIELGLERAYQRARSDIASPHRGDDDARDLEHRLASLGLPAKVTPIRRSGELCLQVEMPVSAWQRLGAKRKRPRAGEQVGKKKRRRGGR